MNSKRTSSDWDVIDTIVRRTADRIGADPVDLEPLASVIDPALVAGFATSDAVATESELRFQFNGCAVRLEGTGTIVVRELD